MIINNFINVMGEMVVFWVLEYVYDIKSFILIEYLFVLEMIDRDILGNL